MTGELLKLRFSRLTWGIGITVFVLVVLAKTLIITIPYMLGWLISLNKVIPNATDADKMSAEQIANLSFSNLPAQWGVADLLGSSNAIMQTAVAGGVLFGALSIASEYRYGSIVTTVQLTPNRLRVMSEKFAAAAIVATVFALALAVLSTLGLTVGALIADTPLHISVGQLLLSWLSGWLVLILMTWLGLAVGFIVRSQLLSIAILVGIGLLESVARPLFALIFGGPTVMSGLPYGLANDVSSHGGTFVGEINSGFPQIMALLLLIVWTALLTVLAFLVFKRRDVEGLG